MPGSHRRCLLANMDFRAKAWPLQEEHWTHCRPFRTVLGHGQAEAARTNTFLDGF